MIKNRISKNVKRLKGFLKQHKIQCFRAYDRDIPEYPYIVDYYPKCIVVYERGKRSVDPEIQKNHFQELKTALLEIFPAHEIVFKVRKVQSGKNQYEREAKKAEFFEIQENQAKFLVNVHDYLDTGIFHDHRWVRQMIYKRNATSFLNLFCYTGTASVFAALSGAKCTSVDLSHTYLDWSERNFELNGLNIEDHEFFSVDSLDFLNRDKQTYDLILLDPPSFSNSKKMKYVFDVQENHIEFIDLAMKRLSPTGMLIFSNNLRSFKMSDEVKSTYNVSDMSEKSIPMDFNDKKIHQCFFIKHKN